MKKINLQTLKEANNLRDPQGLLDLLQEKNDTINSLITLLDKAHVGKGKFQEK